MKPQATQWYQQLAQRWAQLSAFKRFALGLALAIAIAYALMHHQIKPLQQASAALEETLKSDGVPAQVPRPQDDNELQELQLKIESLAGSLETQRAQTHRAIEASSTPPRQEEGRVVGAFDSLVFERGMDLLHRQRTGSEVVAGRVLVSQYAYTLGGPFDRVRDFLEAAQRFPHAFEVCGVSIRSPEAEPQRDDRAVRAQLIGNRRRPRRSASRPTLRVDFTLRLYFVDGVQP